MGKQKIRKADWFDLQELAEAEERQHQEQVREGYGDRLSYVVYDQRVNSKAPHYIEAWLKADADCRQEVAKTTLTKNVTADTSSE